MTLEVIGWSETRAANGLVGIAAASGETGFTVSGDTIQLPGQADGLKILALAAYGANVDEARLDGACFKSSDCGFKAGANPLTTYPAFYRPRYPIPVFGVLEGYQDNGNNNEASQVVAILQGPGGLGKPSVKDVEKFKVDGAQTAVAHTWTSMSVSLPTKLDTSEEWKILDLRVAGATLAAFRIPPPFGNARYGGAGWLGSTAAASLFQDGPPEIFGKIPKGQTSFPLQILCSAGDTSQEIDVLLGR